MSCRLRRPTPLRGPRERKSSDARWFALGRLTPTEALEKSAAQPERRAPVQLHARDNSVRHKQFWTARPALTAQLDHAEYEEFSSLQIPAPSYLEEMPEFA